MKKVLLKKTQIIHNALKNFLNGNSNESYFALNIEQLVEDDIILHATIRLNIHLFSIFLWLFI